MFENFVVVDPGVCLWPCRYTVAYSNHACQRKLKHLALHIDMRTRHTYNPPCNILCELFCSVCAYEWFLSLCALSGFFHDLSMNPVCLARTSTIVNLAAQKSAVHNSSCVVSFCLPPYSHPHTQASTLMRRQLLRQVATSAQARSQPQGQTSVISKLATYACPSSLDKAHGGQWVTMQPICGSR